MLGFNPRHRPMKIGKLLVKLFTAVRASMPGSYPRSWYTGWWSKPPEKSKPAQKLSPAPSRTMTRTSSSQLACRRAASIAEMASARRVLAFSGRFSVIVAIAPDLRYWTTSRSTIGRLLVGGEAALYGGDDGAVLFESTAEPPCRSSVQLHEPTDRTI